VTSDQVNKPPVSGLICLALTTGLSYKRQKKLCLGSRPPKLLSTTIIASSSENIRDKLSLINSRLAEIDLAQLWKTSE